MTFVHTDETPGVDAKWERQEAANAADRLSGLVDIATSLCREFTKGGFSKRGFSN